MSFNGSGAFVINSTGQPVSANTLIEASVFNAFTADIATGLSTVIAKDGQTTITANLPMSGYKFTGLGAGSAAGNSLRYEQLFTTGAVQMLGAMDWVKGADIASATTLNLTTATGNGVHVTGTTTITGVTLGSGMLRLVVFDGILTLTHNATTNNLPGAANITTAAGDRAIYWSDGTTVYCMVYMPAAGYQEKMAAASQAEMEAGTEAALRSMSPLRVAQAIAALGGGSTLTRTTFTASGNLTFPAGVTQAWVTGQGCGGGGGGTTAGGNGGTTTFGPNGGAVVLTLAGGTGGSAASGTTGGAGGAGGGSGVNKGRSGRAGQYKATIGGGVNPAAYCVAVGGRGGSGEIGELGSGGNGGDGGASGGGVSSAAAGGGGGAGEQCFSFPVTVTAAQWDVIIGSAGTAGTADGGTAPQAGQAGFFIVEYLS
jgi:hypothetical protein